MVPYKVGLSYDSKAYGSQFENRMFSIERQVLVATIQLLFANTTLFILYPIFSFYTFFSEFVTKLCNHEAFKFDDARNSIISQCEDLLDRDLRDNKAMGKFGAEAILKGITQKSVLPTRYTHNFRIRLILGHFSENQHFPDLN